MMLGIAIGSVILMGLVLLWRWSNDAVAEIEEAKELRQTCRLIHRTLMTMLEAVKHQKWSDAKWNLMVARKRYSLYTRDTIRGSDNRYAYELMGFVIEYMATALQAAEERHAVVVQESLMSAAATYNKCVAVLTQQIPE
jgi:hypothetical protein